MNYLFLEHSSDRKYPAIELDMTNFVEYLSDEYVCGKAEVRTITTTIDYETKDRADLGELSSVSESELKQEEKVRKFDKKFVLLRTYLNTILCACGN